MTEAPTTTLVTREAMLRHHDPVRIQGYCQSCEKHGAYWSCPPFTEPPLNSLPPWTHALIVCQKTWVSPGSTKENLITQFLDARLAFVTHMVSLETRAPGLYALVAGHCSGCATCTRPDGKPCCRPSKLRYSLEAVGFDVTALAEQLAGQKVHWPKNGLPDYLMTVGALLLPDEACIHRLTTAALA